MTSREIADLTGKQHKDVLYDIRKMFEDLGQTSADFSADLPDTYGRLQPAFNLPKRETLILVSGYSTVLRARIIDRWQELEDAVRKPPVVSANPPGTMTPFQAMRIYCAAFRMACDAGIDSERAHQLAAQTKYEASGWWWQLKPAPTDALLAGPDQALLQ